ncbi:ROK family protein [Streptacidiphilus rugosus]|uniref:ROK family protein n=1 Tax=Streptacidiphilus rugosus TaxID=405783 RepID=UPI000A071576|nr:ROK family protein [Streptacidiphilus rugosus]
MLQERTTAPHPRPLTPAPARTVIGIDFGGTKTEIALAGPDGAVLRRRRLDTLAERGPDQILARAAETVRALAAEAEADLGAPVAAHAAVAPGVIQPDRILLTPNLPGWERLALADRLAGELDVPAVAVANDVRAGALAELRFGALRGVDPGMYVSLGTGIAAALTVGGRVLAGARHAAGEIGYMNPGDAPADAVALGRAPLEELVAGKGLSERALARLGVPLTATELFAGAEPAAKELAAETLTVLARALANLSVFVDPARIVLGGGMMASAATLLPALTRLVGQATPFPPELRTARFLKDASLHGALALALDSLDPLGTDVAAAPFTALRLEAIR